MKLKAHNKNLIKNQPSTILTASVAAAGTTLTVKNNEGFEQNDYALIGKIGQEKTEIKLISGAVTAGTSLTVSACTFAHDIDTPITKIDYDSIEFSNAATATGTKTAITCSGQSASTFPIDPSGEFTYCEDATNATGYGFFRFVDTRPTPDTYSVYSDAFPYTGRTKYMLCSIRKKVRRLLNEPDDSLISDDEIDDEINLAQTEIAHDRLWSFYEKTYSFSSVTNQWQYSLSSSVFKPYAVKYDSQPLAIIDKHRIDNLRWDSDTTGDPTHICMWDDKAEVYPYPDSAADTTTLNGAHTATVTTLTVADNSDFRDQGRVKVNDEVILYTGKSGTTSLTGCTREAEGTTAAAHSSGDTVTERDFIYHFQEDPDDLDDETDTTAIPNPDVIAYKATYELAPKKDDQALADRMMLKYDRAMEQLRKVDQPKIKMSFGRVKNYEQVVEDKSIWRDPNEYPTGLS